MTRFAFAVSLLLAGCPGAEKPAPRTAPALSVVEPSEGNLFVSDTGPYLFVAWSVPKDLAPLRPVLDDPAALEEVVARTAVRLCATKRAELSVADKPCKLQLLRLGSNDEYSKSAAGSWTTVGKFVLSPEASGVGAFSAVMEMDGPAIVKTFERFELKRAELE